MPQHNVQLCQKGAELNRSCRFRKGNVIHLPVEGNVIVSGDLHGNVRNFERIVKLADLENNPQTHVILQEIIHGGPEDDFGGCLSWRLLFDAIRYAVRFPDQVHILLGNHDTAAISNSSVLKAGKEMNRAMWSAMKRHFTQHYNDIHAAMCEYLMSQPLAVRTPNRIWLSHSLPADRYVDEFDPTIFNRSYDINDIERPNSVYLLTWGRHHSPDTLKQLAHMLDVDIFILGHQPQDMGWALAGPNTMIIASEHSFGCVLKFELDKTYTLAGLSGNIIPLNSIE
jgi:hypothetical protein